MLWWLANVAAGVLWPTGKLICGAERTVADGRA